MNFKEPKKKKRVFHQLESPFPIPLNKDDDWVTYTAHLSASGTCIAHPQEMAAVYCMGYFGKGSLSRGFPSFGKRRFGAPPQVRERQWKRRKQWLEDVKKLEKEPLLFGENGPEELSIADAAEKAEDCGEIDVKGEIEEFGEKEGENEAVTAPGGRKIDAEDAGEEEMVQEDGEKAEKEGKLEEKAEKEGKSEKKAEKEAKSEKNEEKEVKLEEKEGKLGEKVLRKEGKSEENAEKEGKSEENAEKDVKCEEKVFKKEAEPKSEVLDEKNEEKDIDEVVLDSTEDEEVCEIVDNDQGSSRLDSESQGSQGDDVCVLNDDDDPMKSHLLDLFDEKEKPEEDPNEMLIIPDSDSDNESYLKNIKPRLDTEGFPVTETLQLTFEETFFLMFGLGCLQVVDYDGNFFSIVDAWRHFNEQDKDFFSKYIVYHYFRSKGWVVKPGLKCAGDFVLYKKGPPLYHASYIVLIEVADADNLLRDDAKTSRDMTWSNILTLNRLSQTLSKELLIAQVLWPSTVSQSSNPVPLEALSEFTVRELLIRRWNPNDTCETVPLDDEEDDETDDDSS